MAELELTARPLITPGKCLHCAFIAKNKQGMGRHLSSNAGKFGHPPYTSLRKGAAKSKGKRSPEQVVGAEFHELANAAVTSLQAVLKWADTRGAENVLLKRDNAVMAKQLAQIKQANELILAFDRPA